MAEMWQVMEGDWLATICSRWRRRKKVKDGCTRQRSREPGTQVPAPAPPPAICPPWQKSVKSLSFCFPRKCRQSLLLLEGWETSCRGGRWIPFVCFLEQLYWAINHPFKTTRSTVFYILADSCKHPNFRTFPLPQKSPLAVTPPQPSSSTCRQPQIYFPISTDLLFLDIKYKWNHTIFCE